MKLSRSKPSEFQVQAAIVDVLRLAGFAVYHTTAYKQKGSSGVSRGIPDLLVAHNMIPWTYFGLEIKRPGKIQFSSHEQAEAAQMQRFEIAQNPTEALTKARMWFGRHLHAGIDAGVYMRMFQKIDNVLTALGANKVAEPMSAEQIELLKARSEVGV